MKRRTFLAGITAAIGGALASVGLAQDKTSAQVSDDYCNSLAEFLRRIDALLATDDLDPAIRLQYEGFRAQIISWRDFLNQLGYCL